MAIGGDVPTYRLQTEVPLLDEVLGFHAAELGKDFAGYRNHAYRVVNFCTALRREDPASTQKIVLAAAFHDLGIWTDGSFDYLAPSEKLVRVHLDRNGKGEWAQEIAEMIQQHHKITRVQSNPDGLVETFRKADWVDVSRGITFGLPRSFLVEVFSAFPNAGFHMCLVRLAMRRFVRHPLNPLPMIRL